MYVTVDVLMSSTQLAVLAGGPLEVSPEAYDQDLVLSADFVTVCQEAIMAADPDPMAASFPVHASFIGPAAMRNLAETDAVFGDPVPDLVGDKFVLRICSRVSNFSDRSEAVMAAKADAVLDALCAEVGDRHLRVYDPQPAAAH